MGHIKTRIRLIGGKGSTNVMALADTGASLTTIPLRLATKIGIKINEYDSVETGNGVIKMAVGEVTVVIMGKKVRTRCWISDFINKVLLGAVVLEEIGYTINPNKRIIEKRRLHLYIASCKRQLGHRTKESKYRLQLPWISY